MQRKSYHIFIILFMISAAEIYAQKIQPDLKFLINRAIKKNHEKKINNFEIERTKIQQKNLWNNYLPKLYLNASYTRLDNDIKLDNNLQKLLMGTEKLLIKEAYGIPFNTPLPPQVSLIPIPKIQDKNILKSSLDAEWLLFSGLKISQASKVLEHKSKALEYQNNIIEERLVGKLVKTYHQLALIQSTQQVLNTMDDYLQKQENFVSKAKKNGLAIELDLQKIALAQQKLKIKQLSLENSKRLVLETLHQMTDIPTDRLKTMDIGLDKILINFDKLKGEQPYEMHALNEKLTAQKYQKKMAYTAYIPKLMLKGHYELLKDDLTMLDPKWYVGIGLKWDIFDGFKAWNQSKQIQLQENQTQEKIREADELIHLQQLQAQLNYQTSLEKIEETKKQVKIAKYTYQLSKKQYENGLISITDLLKSLNDLKIAKLDYTKALYEENNAAIAYLKAYGNLLNIIK